MLAPRPLLLSCRVGIKVSGVRGASGSVSLLLRSAPLSSSPFLSAPLCSSPLLSAPLLSALLSTPLLSAPRHCSGVGSNTQVDVMTQKVVLITGCSSGVGLALAVRIAGDEKKRFIVYATMRELSRGRNLVEAAGRTLGRTLHVKQLDVCDDASIKQCVDSLPERKVDILISNAALGLVGPIECQSMDEMKAVIDTNFFGLVRLTKEVLPDMKRRKRGHVVVISSVMGVQGILFNDVYAASKFAMEGFCESLAVQALKFKLKFSVIEPGPVRTGFEQKLYDEVVKTDLSKADEVTADMFTNVYLKHFKEVFETLGQTPEDIAEHVLQIISMKKPPFRHQTNALYTPGADLSADAFHGAAFERGAVFSTSVNVFRLLCWQSRKTFAFDRTAPAPKTKHP